MFILWWLTTAGYLRMDSESQTSVNYILKVLLEYDPVLGTYLYLKVKARLHKVTNLKSQMGHVIHFFLINFAK